jgi:AcrR family transcriptional regulator
MPAIAAAAGVSVQSLYKAFGHKPALLKTVFDVAIAGDDEPAPMLQRAALGRVQAEPDPHRKLSLYGQFVADVSPRHVPIQLLVRAAAATDPEAAAVWDQLRAKPFFAYFAPGATHAPTRSPPNGPTGTRASSTRAGTSCGRIPSPARSSSA